MSRHIPTFFSVAALLLVAAACEDNRANNSSAKPATAPPAAAPQAQEGPVTNTNAAVPAKVDILANVVNRTMIHEPSDETKILPARAAMSIPGFSVPLRSSPWGEPIGTLKAGIPIAEIARDPKGEYYLVRYPDPMDGSKELGGWIAKQALENTAWAAQESAAAPGDGKPATTRQLALTCKKGEAHLRTDHEFCAQTCKDDGACGATRAEICDGLAFEVHPASNQTSVQYCVAAPTERAGRPTN